jgi:hypothetical protein
VLGCIEGRRVIDLAAEAGVTRKAVNRWLQWYESMGVDGLVTGKAPLGFFEPCSIVSG